jgi:hypothetical protein
MPHHSTQPPSISAPTKPIAEPMAQRHDLRVTLKTVVGRQENLSRRIENVAGVRLLPTVLEIRGLARSVLPMDVSLDMDAAGALAVKLQADEWEVNFRASRIDLTALSQIRSADWDERRSIRGGSQPVRRSSGHPMARTRR